MSPVWWGLLAKATAGAILLVIVAAYFAVKADLAARERRMREASREAQAAQRAALRTVATITPLAGRKGKMSAREHARRKARAAAKRGSVPVDMAAWLLFLVVLYLVVALAAGGTLWLATVLWGCAAAIAGQLW